MELLAISTTASPLYETYVSDMSFPRNSLLRDSLDNFRLGQHEGPDVNWLPPS